MSISDPIPKPCNMIDKIYTESNSKQTISLPFNRISLPEYKKLSYSSLLEQ